MPTRELPTGTITFLFSDIEGSTRLVAAVGPAVFREVLETHNALLRAALETHGGTERGTQGDSFLVMFHDPGEAAAAAVDAQRAIAAYVWPTAAPVTVRIGLHTGLGILGGDDYVGLDVNRAARIAAAAHGGQILISDATRALLAHSLPPGVVVRDLGEHGLRDLPGMEHLFQLVVPGLRADFPSIRSASSPIPDLPDRAHRLIGRERELDELSAMVSAQRLVTLTGPGGTGKSSLALEVGRQVVKDRTTRVHWVPLSSVTDPAFVASAVADRLGVVPSVGRTPLDGACDVIADRDVLLILDNMEQVLDAAMVVDELLRRAPRLRVLVTSRAPLHLSLEQEYPVAPLPVPGPGDAALVVLETPAVRLFLERAARVRPGFVAEGNELDAVATVCRRLDGLPLGIEIAASRVGLLTPRDIAERLGRRLDLPGQALRDVPERQRTLTATIAWSHDLLDASLQGLFAQLSVFAGGGRLEEVESVCGAGDPHTVDVLEGLTRLVDQNLVLARSDPDGLRIRMLDTIGIFAHDRLAADPVEMAATRRRHALAYLALAETAAGNMPGRGQVIWLDRLTLDHDNLRAATDWAIEAGATDIALRLGASTWRFWQLRGYLDEGRAVMDRIVAMPATGAPSLVRVQALRAAGSLAWWAADILAADTAYGEAVALARLVGDRRVIADAAFDHGHTRHSLGDMEAVVQLSDEARRIYVELDDRRGLARLAWTSGFTLLATGRVNEARDLMLGLMPTFEALDDEFYVAMTAFALGGISLQLGAREEAAAWGLRAMLAHHAMGDLASFTLGLRGFALMFLSMGHTAEAALLNSAFEALCRRFGIRPPSVPATFIPVIATDQATLARLTSDEWAAEIERGGRMSVDEAMEELLRLAKEGGIGPASSRAAGGPPAPEPTRR